MPCYSIFRYRILFGKVKIFEETKNFFKIIL
nr:MAG TPA: hypothetical protein [Caudoviricetes sp.]